MILWVSFWGKFENQSQKESPSHIHTHEDDGHRIESLSDGNFDSSTLSGGCNDCIDPVSLGKEGGKRNAKSNCQQPHKPLTGCIGLEIIPVFKSDWYDRGCHEGNSETQEEQEELSKEMIWAGLEQCFYLEMQIQNNKPRSSDSLVAKPVQHGSFGGAMSTPQTPHLLGGLEWPIPRPKPKPTSSQNFKNWSQVPTPPSMQF